MSRIGTSVNDRWTIVKLLYLSFIQDISKHPHFKHIYRINNIINISWLPPRSHICRTCTLARHLSLGSSMVRASHRSSEGRGFDPRPGLNNRFSENRVWRTFIYHSFKLSPSTHISNTYHGVGTGWHTRIWRERPRERLYKTFKG